MVRASKTARIDREALSAFYHATKGNKWLNNEGWLSNLKLKDWNGVEVNASGRVVSLHLGGGKDKEWMRTESSTLRKQLILNNLTGPIPSDLGALSSLEELRLSCNRLDGLIPSELGSLAVLLKLDLSCNNLTGPIPIELGTLTILLKLDLSSNKLTGSIPRELARMTALQALYLYRNELTGPMPSELGNLTALQHLRLDANMLTGPIPSELGNLTALQYLRLNFNELTGPIPSELGNLTALQHLHLNFNKLTGSIPSELGNLTALQHLRLDANMLNELIPSQLGNLTALQLLDLDDNKLTGPIPSELGNLTALQHLHLNLNKLTGMQRGWMLAEQHETTKAWTARNAVAREIPLHAMLGPIPSELGNLTALQHLRLFCNILTGSIPRELERMTALQTLYLYRNELTGPIPSELGNLTALQHLYVNLNKLTGLGKGEDAGVVLDLLSRVEHFYLGNNPWECPPAPVVSKGIGPMKKYSDELKRADPVFIDSRKVVFIGCSGAGKTSLIKSIKAGKGQLTQGEELESVGVSVQCHRFETGVEGEAEVKLYDLAGQVEYYGLHQLFLTERALYVLVWNASDFLGHKEELLDHLHDWMTTLHLRAPRSTVLLCGTHKDKCLANNLFAKSMAWLRRSPSVEAIMEDVEQSIKNKYEQWKREPRTRQPRMTSRNGGLQVERRIQLVSSSPTWPYSKSGLPDLQQRLKECGNGSRWLIPPSWCHALIVLDALRDGVNPVEAVRRYLKPEDPLPVVTTEKLSWVHWETLRLHWKHVQDSVDLPAELKPEDPDFALESAMDLRERGGSLLKHPQVVFLDVEELALTLASILNHKMGQEHPPHAHFSSERQPEERWISEARKRLMSEGVLEARFARSLWKKDNIDMPQQIFVVLVKLGILLPLIPPRYTWDVSLGTMSPWEHVKEYMVLMRLPLKASCETMACFNAFEKLREEWGVVAKWKFDRGRNAYGLVERLVASCHAIGNVVMDTCWREGACFVGHQASINAAGGSFALAVQLTRCATLNKPTAGTLVVQAFGSRDGRAVWGALRFVISSAWRLFEEFPELGWEAWVECPKHHGQVQHCLAGVSDSKGRSPGDPIVPSGARLFCGCPQGASSRLGTVLRTQSVWGPCPLTEVFTGVGGGGQGRQSSDEDEEKHYTAALDSVLNAKMLQQKTQIVDEAAESEGWRMPEWAKDVVVAGPTGALLLYEAWSPLLNIIDYWREGLLEQAIPLTVFAAVLAVAVIGAVAAVFRKLRFKFRVWPPRTDTKND